MRRKPLRLAVLAALALLLLVACGDDPPPTQIVIVVTPTPVEDGPGTDEPRAVDPAPTATSPEPTTEPQVEAPTEEASTTVAATLAPTATPLPALFPTNTVADVQLAETVYENGRMFWIRHSRQIWVMVGVPEGAQGGDWFCYNDTFVEGEAEIDPELVPPDGMYQPRRGFGKLWREHPDLQQALGWAITPEFELTSNYTYIAGGYVQDGQYYPAAGEHRLTTLYGETISFYESDVRGDCMGGTWRMATGE